MVVVETNGDFIGASERQLRCGSAARDGAGGTPGHPAGASAVPGLFVEAPQAPKAQTWLRGERVSSAHAKQRRRDWLGKLPGRARAAAPRPPHRPRCRRHRPPRAGAPGTRVAPRGAPACPGGCCRATALRGHPTRYVPAGPAPVDVAVPNAGPPGKAGGTHCATRPRAPGGMGQRGCRIRQLPAPGQFWPRGVFFLSSPRASVSPAWLLAHVRRGQAARCRAGHSLHATPMAPAATGFPGDPVLGTGTRWCSGGGRGRRAPRSWGLPGDVALSPQGGRDKAASRFGGGQ